MGRCTNVDTVWFQVRDMERAKSFYQDVLGLACQYESPYWTSLRCGDVGIGLHGPGEPATPSPVGGWVVSLLTEDLVELSRALQAAGADQDDEFHDTPRGAILSFRDPDGNRLQAMQLGTKAADLQ